MFRSLYCSRYRADFVGCPAPLGVGNWTDGPGGGKFADDVGVDRVVARLDGGLGSSRCWAAKAIVKRQINAWVRDDVHRLHLEVDGISHGDGRCELIFCPTDRGQKIGRTASRLFKGGRFRFSRQLLHGGRSLRVVRLKDEVPFPFFEGVDEPRTGPNFLPKAEGRRLACTGIGLVGVERLLVAERGEIREVVGQLPEKTQACRPPITPATQAHILLRCHRLCGPCEVKSARGENGTKTQAQRREFVADQIL